MFKLYCEYLVFFTFWVQVIFLSSPRGAQGGLEAKIHSECRKREWSLVRWKENKGIERINGKLIEYVFVKTNIISIAKR